VDHIIFKHNAYTTILEDKIENTSMPDHHSCRLGKWYDGEGKKLFGNTKAYKAIELHHKKVHEKTREAVSCVKAKDCTTTSRECVIADMAEVEKESFALFDLFVQMVEEGNPEVQI
jgi:hypothetical protein